MWNEQVEHSLLHWAGRDLKSPVEETDAAARLAPVGALIAGFAGTLFMGYDNEHWPSGKARRMTEPLLQQAWRTFNRKPMFPDRYLGNQMAVLSDFAVRVMAPEWCERVPEYWRLGEQLRGLPCIAMDAAERRRALTLLDLNYDLIEVHDRYEDADTDLGVAWATASSASHAVRCAYNILALTLYEWSGGTRRINLMLDLVYGEVGSQLAMMAVYDDPFDVNDDKKQRARVVRALDKINAKHLTLVATCVGRMADLPDRSMGDEGKRIVERACEWWAAPTESEGADVS